MLDDPETAQYTHTLTVTGRLQKGTIYQCTVANNKPSKASAHLTVEGIIINDNNCRASLIHNYLNI